MLKILLVLGQKCFHSKVANLLDNLTQTNFWVK